MILMLNHVLFIHVVHICDHVSCHRYVIISYMCNDVVSYFIMILVFNHSLLYMFVVHIYNHISCCRYVMLLYICTQLIFMMLLLIMYCLPMKCIFIISYLV